MLYELQTPYRLTAKSDFIDLSNYLHRFLHMQTVSVGIRFRTENAGYQSLFAIYYKESLLPVLLWSYTRGRADTHRPGGMAKCWSGAVRRHTATERYTSFPSVVRRSA